MKPEQAVHHARHQDKMPTALIYQPFVAWIGAEHGITAEVRRDLPVADLAGHAGAGTPVIASVHSWIRWPERTPPGRGGHLVLVTGVVDGLLLSLIHI